MSRDIAQILRLGAGSDLEALWLAAEDFAEAYTQHPGEYDKITVAAERLVAAVDAIHEAPGEAELAALMALRRTTTVVAACTICHVFPRECPDGEISHLCELSGDTWRGSLEEWNRRQK